MSYGVDIVYEALLAIGAVHRSSLVACQEGNSQEAARFKVLGLRSYGKILQLLPTQLSRKSSSATFATLVVLMLLAYFEVNLPQSPLSIFPSHVQDSAAMHNPADAIAIVLYGESKRSTPTSLGCNPTSPRFRSIFVR
jgi:hypothetical protein